MDVNAEELNRKARLDFARKHLKKTLPMFWNKILWTDETNINFHQIDGKRKVAKEKEQLIQSTPHQVSNMVATVLWHGHVWLFVYVY